MLSLNVTFILQIFQCMEKLSDAVHWENWRNNQDWRVCIFVYLLKKKSKFMLMPELSRLVYGV